MRELLSNNSLFVGQLYEDKSLAQQFTAGADLFLKYTTQQPSYCELTTSADKNEKVHWASMAVIAFWRLYGGQSAYSH